MPRRSGLISRRRAIAAMAIAPMLAVRKARADDSLTTLAFFNGPNGQSPSSGLIPDGSGNYYGTTELGGAGSFGTVFRITSAGVFRTLASFEAHPSEYPSGLAVDPLGNLIVTVAGSVTSMGEVNSGAILRFTPDGERSTLHSFVPSEYATHPIGPVTFDSAGNAYGTAAGLYLPFEESPIKAPVIFKIKRNGVLSLLHDFSGSSTPNPGLSLDSKGNLYGTTNGGPTRSGSIFQLSTLGILSTLHDFSGPDGLTPSGPLLMDSQGNLYGTTLAGGADNLGTVYQLARSGELSTLYSFSGPDGSGPTGPLTADAMGNLYGTCLGGGSGGSGTVFLLSSGGSLVTLHGFSGPDGAGPMQGVTIDAQGNLLGTTRLGGPENFGSAFRLSPA